jgi:hypothetical protein
MTVVPLLGEGRSLQAIEKAAVPKKGDDQVRPAALRMCGKVIPHFGFKKSDVARMWPRKGHFPAREPELVLVNIGLFRLLGDGSQNCHNGREHPVPSSTDALGVMLTRFPVWLHG